MVSVYEYSWLAQLSVRDVDLSTQKSTEIDADFKALE